MNPNLSVRLDAHLHALDQGLSEAMIESAQHTLQQRLAATPVKRARRAWIGWLATAATACLMLALVMLPAEHGIAFDAVQKRLSDFNTLTLHIDQHAQGMAMPGITVRMNRAGDVRTDLGSASSVIVNVQANRILTLLHDSHRAMQIPLPAGASRTAEPLAWLDSIRTFQGKAQALPQTRVIDGRPTTGWALDSGGMHIVIWADADALPHAVEIHGHGQQLTQRMHVAMDTPIDPQVFSTALPPGYSLAQPDED